MKLVINDRRHAALAANDPNRIPPITDPDGRYWDQPNPDTIQIDATHALMTKDTFEQLKEYSGTQPTGAYEGKMWRRNDGSFDRAFLAAGGKPTWLLCWYGRSMRGPGWVSTFHRKILLLDADIETYRMA